MVFIIPADSLPETPAIPAIREMVDQHNTICRDRNAALIAAMDTGVAKLHLPEPAKVLLPGDVQADMDPKFLQMIQGTGLKLKRDSAASVTADAATNAAPAVPGSIGIAPGDDGKTLVITAGTLDILILHGAMQRQGVICEQDEKSHGLTLRASGVYSDRMGGDRLQGGIHAEAFHERFKAALAELRMSLKIDAPPVTAARQVSARAPRVHRGAEMTPLPEAQSGQER